MKEQKLKRLLCYSFLFPKKPIDRQPESQLERHQAAAPEKGGIRFQKETQNPNRKQKSAKRTVVGSGRLGDTLNTALSCY